MKGQEAAEQGNRVKWKGHDIVQLDDCIWSDTTRHTILVGGLRSRRLVVLGIRDVRAIMPRTSRVKALLNVRSR